jgi:hypothetical protein
MPFQGVQGRAGLGWGWFVTLAATLSWLGRRMRARKDAVFWNGWSPDWLNSLSSPAITGPGRHQLAPLCSIRIAGGAAPGQGWGWTVQQRDTCAAPPDGVRSSALDHTSTFGAQKPCMRSEVHNNSGAERAGSLEEPRLALDSPPQPRGGPELRALLEQPLPDPSASRYSGAVCRRRHSRRAHPRARASRSQPSIQAPRCRITSPEIAAQ